MSSRRRRGRGPARPRLAAQPVRRPRPPAPSHPRDLAARSALVLLCVAPVAVIPGGENRFVFGKLAVYAAGVGLAALGRSRGRLPAPVAWLLAGGIAVTAISAAFTSDPLTAIVGTSPRYEGLPVLGLYAAAGWAGARLLGAAPDPGQVRTVEWTLTVTALAVAFIAILETAGLRPLASNLTRPGSLLGNASDEGALGVLLAGVLGRMALARSGRAVAVPAAGAAAALVIVGLSASRAALVGVAVAVAVLAAVSAPARRVVLAAAVVVVAGLVLGVPASRARVTGSNQLATATAHGRLLLWQETLGLIGRHPVIGAGPGTFLDAITIEHDLRWQKDVGPANPPDSPHDWILQVGAAGGILLLGVVGGICVLTGRAGWRRVEQERQRAPAPAGGDALATGALAGVAGYGVALLFGFTTPGTTPLAAVLGGIVLAEPVSVRAARLEVLTRVVAAVGAAALLVLALLAAAAEVQIRWALDAAGNGELSPANAHFHSALSLRWWDPSIEEIAGHAFVVIAQSTGSSPPPQAVSLAAYWVARARSDLPGSEQVALDQASVDELRSDYVPADALLLHVLQRDPLDPAVLLRLGVVQGESGQLQPAVATLLEVTRIDPTSPDPWNDLAVAYRLQGNSTLAAQARATAARLAPHGTASG